MPIGHVPFDFEVDSAKIRIPLFLVALLGCLGGTGVGAKPRESVSRSALQTQADPSPVLRLIEVRTDPEPPAFGEPFRIQVILRMPGGAAAFLPDTLSSSEAVESFGAGSWIAVPVRGDSAEIRASYPVMAFREGAAELPTLEAWLATADSLDFAPENAVRSADELGSDPSSRAQPYRFRLGTTSVAAFLADGDSAGGLSPRPAADVTGGEWNVWILLAASLVVAVVAGAAWVRRWRGLEGEAAREGATSHLPPREGALQELDRILALGWHRNGRTVEFYRTTTDVLRRFAGEIEPEWGRALTSSELITRMEERWGAAAMEGVGEAVRFAEWVKFGTHRANPEVARKHWEAIRGWIEEGPAQRPTEATSTASVSRTEGKGEET